MKNACAYGWKADLSFRLTWSILLADHVFWTDNTKHESSAQTSHAATKPRGALHSTISSSLVRLQALSGGQSNVTSGYYGAPESKASTNMLVNMLIIEKQGLLETHQSDQAMPTDRESNEVPYKKCGDAMRII